MPDPTPCPCCDDTRRCTEFGPDLCLGCGCGTPVWLDGVPYPTFPAAFAAYLAGNREGRICRDWTGDGEWLDGLSASERATVLAADRGAA